MQNYCVRDDSILVCDWVPRIVCEVTRIIVDVKADNVKNNLVISMICEVSSH